MNALFVSNDPTIFEDGSAARARMRTYADFIAADGGLLHILSRAPKTVEQSDGPLHLHGVHVSRLGRMRVFVGRARTLIREHGIHIVSAQDPFEHGLAALDAVRGTDAKLHIQVHTDFCSPYFAKGAFLASVLNRIRVSIADRVLPKASGIRVVSERVKGELVARYGTNIVEPTVLPIQVPSTVPAPVPLPAGVLPFTLIAVGRLEAEKRYEDLLTALAIVREHYPGTGLIIAGSGRMRKKLEKFAAARNVTLAVQFLGDRTDVGGLMKSAHTFIQTSAYEGYGRTLIEAALAEIPIITTDVGIVGEVLKSGTDALVAPVGDVTALAAHMRTIIEDNQLRRVLTLNAQHAVQEHLAAFADLPDRIVRDLSRVAAGSPKV